MGKNSKYPVVLSALSEGENTCSARLSDPLSYGKSLKAEQPNIVL